MHMVIVSLLRNAELEALLAGSDQSGRKVLEGRKLTESVLTHTIPAQKPHCSSVSCPAGLETEPFLDGVCKAVHLQVLSASPSSASLQKELNCKGGTF